MTDHIGERRTPWSAEDIAIAAAIWAAECGAPGSTRELSRGEVYRTVKMIADAVGRSPSAVDARRRQIGFWPKIGPIIAARNRISERLMDDAAARASASESHSLVGAMMGDPPPGFSALDRKRGVEP